MMRTTLRALLLGALVSTSACLVTTGTPVGHSGAPVSGNGQLVGTVTDDSGAPLARVGIELNGGGGRGTGKNAQTDASGTFTMPELTPGSYGLRCARDGYTKVEQTVEIRPGETTEVSCSLHKK